MADKKSSAGGTVEKLVGSYECRQGAVRAVRFNSKFTVFFLYV